METQRDARVLVCELNYIWDWNIKKGEKLAEENSK